jgi:uncharacterized protein (DUF305 family)
MKKKPFLYGIIGLLVGILLTGLFASYAVNSNHSGMMKMMGINNNRSMRVNMDQNFIEQMIPHHESAIAMAKVAQQKATHSEIKTLAGNIITSQTNEINTMKEYYKNWYGKDVPTVTTDHMWGGMTMDSHASIDALNNVADFDEAFLKEMIPHHQMAVMMANMLDITTNRPEMKKLASDIVATQTKEISDMKSWQSQWGYGDSSVDSNSHDMSHMMDR